MGPCVLTDLVSTPAGRSLYDSVMSSALAVLNRVAAGRVLGPLSFATPSPGPLKPYDIRRIPRTSGAYPGFALEPTWNSDRAVKEGLKVCATLATCLGRVAEKGGSVPWYEWESKKSGSPKRVDIVPWMEWPRQDGKVSRSQLMEEGLLHASISGNALIGILWEGGKRRLRPREIQVENPYRCRPIPHRIDFISGYEWDDVAFFGPQKWDALDIVHVIGRNDPSNRYWGWSILEALAHTIDADVEARKLNLRRYRNGGQPGTIIIDSTVRQDEDRDEVEENLNRSAQKRYGGFMLLGGNMSVERQNALTNRQLGLLETMAFHRDEIAVACDFLPAMFNPGAATYDNVEHAIRHEWRVTVLRLQRFADAFTKRLIPKEDRGRRWYAPYFGDVEELQDLQRKIDDTAKLVKDCRIAVNDAIEVTGLPVKRQRGGDRALVPANLIPDTDAAQSLDDGGISADAGALDIFADECGRNPVWASMVKKDPDLSQQYQETLSDYLADMAEE